MYYDAFLYEKKKKTLWESDICHSNLNKFWSVLYIRPCLQLELCVAIRAINSARAYLH